MPRSFIRNGVLFGISVLFDEIGINEPDIVTLGSFVGSFSARVIVELMYTYAC